VRNLRRRFYVVATADLATQPPDALYHAIQCPGTPQRSLVVVEHWTGYNEQDTWEAIPSVVELYPEQWGGIVPPAMVTAFAPWGVTATDTLRQAAQKIRAVWGVFRD